ncbi:DHH family phosphoesterase [Candidatus Woesearchaeota archaeon]|nr:DHH family phosphoesterase [Candidatus Woesearchaeota archaeon]
MITLKQIKNFIEKSQNPLIFFDDDPDGLVSYLLIRKHFGKGKGVAVKGKPMLDTSYLLSVKKYNPDLILVLDKPIIEQEFVDKVNVPIIWIDHHPVVNIKGVKYYNPRIKDNNDNRCISHWCYQLTKENMWVAAIGIVADYQKPSFIKTFTKKYPELLKDFKDQKEVMFNSNLGKLIRIFGHSLKGKTEDVNRNIEILTKVNDPFDILEGKNEVTKNLLIRLKPIEKEYDRVLKKAVEENKGKDIVIFVYPSGKYSFSAELSNELMYKFPDKFVIVAREKDGEMKISLRNPEKKGYDLPKIIEKALIGLEGYGGGHTYAAGASVKRSDFEQFLSIIKEELSK